MKCSCCQRPFTSEVGSSRIPLFFSCCGEGSCLACALKHHEEERAVHPVPADGPHFTCPLCGAAIAIDFTRPAPDMYLVNNGLCRMEEHPDQYPLCPANNSDDGAVLGIGGMSEHDFVWCDEVDSASAALPPVLPESSLAAGGHGQVILRPLSPGVDERMGPGNATVTIHPDFLRPPLNDALRQLAATPKLAHQAIAYCERCWAKPATVYCAACAGQGRPGLLCNSEPACSCPDGAPLDHDNGSTPESCGPTFALSNHGQSAKALNPATLLHQPVPLQALRRDSVTLQDKITHHRARLVERQSELFRDLSSARAHGERLKQTVDESCNLLLAAVQQIQAQLPTYIEGLLATKLQTTSLAITSLSTLLNTLQQIGLPVAISTSVGSVEDQYRAVTRALRLYETLMTSAEFHDIARGEELPGSSPVTLHSAGELLANCQAEWAHLAAPGGRVGSLLASLAEPSPPLPLVDQRLGAILTRLHHITYNLPPPREHRVPPVPIPISLPVSITPEQPPPSLSELIGPLPSILIRTLPPWTRTVTLLQSLVLPYALLHHDDGVGLVRHNCDVAPPKVQLTTTLLAQNHTLAALPQAYSIFNARGERFRLTSAGVDRTELLVWQNHKVRRISNHKTTHRYHMDDYYYRRHYGYRTGADTIHSDVILQVEDLPALCTILVLSGHGLFISTERVAAGASEQLRLLVPLAPFYLTFAPSATLHVPTLTLTPPCVAVLDHRVLIFHYNTYLVLDMKDYANSDPSPVLPARQSLPTYRGIPLQVIKCTLNVAEMVAYFITADDEIVVCTWLLRDDKCEFTVELNATQSAQDHCPGPVRALHYCSRTPTRLYCEVSRRDENGSHTALVMLDSASPPSAAQEEVDPAAKPECLSEIALAAAPVAEERESPSDPPVTVAPAHISEAALAAAPVIQQHTSPAKPTEAKPAPVASTPPRNFSVTNPTDEQVALMLAKLNVGLVELAATSPTSVSVSSAATNSSPSKPRSPLSAAAPAFAPGLPPTPSSSVASTKSAPLPVRPASEHERNTVAFLGTESDSEIAASLAAIEREQACAGDALIAQMAASQSEKSGVSSPHIDLDAEVAAGTAAYESNIIHERTSAAGPSAAIANRTTVSAASPASAAAPIFPVWSGGQQAASPPTSEPPFRPWVPDANLPSAATPSAATPPLPKAGSPIAASPFRSWGSAGSGSPSAATERASAPKSAAAAAAAPPKSPAKPGGSASAKSPPGK